MRTLRSRKSVIFNRPHREMLGQRDISNPTSHSEQDCSHAVSRDLIQPSPKTPKDGGCTSLGGVSVPGQQFPAVRAFPTSNLSLPSPSLQLVPFVTVWHDRGVWLCLCNDLPRIYRQLLAHPPASSGLLRAFSLVFAPLGHNKSTETHRSSSLLSQNHRMV